LAEKSRKEVNAEVSETVLVVEEGTPDIIFSLKDTYLISCNERK
jgi:hypothetical protein